MAGSLSTLISGVNWVWSNGDRIVNYLDFFSSSINACWSFGKLISRVRDSEGITARKVSDIAMTSLNCFNSVLLAKGAAYCIMTQYQIDMLSQDVKAYNMDLGLAQTVVNLKKNRENLARLIEKRNAEEASRAREFEQGKGFRIFNYMSLFASKTAESIIEYQSGKKVTDIILNSSFLIPMGITIGQLSLTITDFKHERIICNAKKSVEAGSRILFLIRSLFESSTIRIKTTRGDDISFPLEYQILDDTPEVFSHPILGARLCGISGKAIRIPILIEGEDGVYELSILIAWIDYHKSSPLTGLKKSLDDIMLDIDAYEEIESVLESTRTDCKSRLGACCTVS
ncbi:MAG: hypothetical protein K9M07_03190 [Simkaniaceae bacterium]|nr:hypothetical protein [Simkaniaceae bacterium]